MIDDHLAKLNSLLEGEIQQENILTQDNLELLDEDSGLGPLSSSIKSSQKRPPSGKESLCSKTGSVPGNTYVEKVFNKYK